MEAAADDEGDAWFNAHARDRAAVGEVYGHFQRRGRLEWNGLHIRC